MICRATKAVAGAGIVGFLLAGIVLAGGPAATAKAETVVKPDRYSIAGGCFAIRSLANGSHVARSGDGYAATAGGGGGAEPFRMQATTLGRYLLYDSGRRFLALDGEAIAAAAEPSNDADWTVHEDGDAFTLTNEFAGRQLAASGDGTLVSTTAGSAGAAGRFEFVEASGCAAFPDAEVNAVGRPRGGSPSYGEVDGLLDAHNHLMAFELAGGSLHCGRPWHPYGIAYALVDCPDHQPNGEGAVVENIFKNGTPVGTHDTDGWPSFQGWPAHDSLTHEQTYYRWIERSWRGGLRVLVNLLVDQGAVCEVYPLKRNPCDEMNTIRLELEHTYALQDYIDAQHGGPGKGWFRIVRNPFQARKVINKGKLAVVLGIETSELFGCIHNNNDPRCSREQIDHQLKWFHRRGVRQMELINKLDNSFGGVAFDSGEIGVVSNTGNKYKTGSFFQIEHCDGHEHDNPQIGVPGAEQGSVFSAALQAFLPPGQAPVYPEPPHCNTRGLTAHGQYLVRQMMRKGMIVDPDHLSVLARNQLLSQLEARRYSGVISSHSWSTPGAFPRIYWLGGVITPISSDSEHFVEEWRQLRPLRRPRHYFGFGFGADSNGFHKQPAPRGGDNPVTYPFRSFDGSVKLDRQTSGIRVYDVNEDGVAHYGLYPDWVEDLRRLAGPKIVRDMGRGAEAYLQMWERARGIPPVRCNVWRRPFMNERGLGTRVRIGDRQRRVLRRAGQPVKRTRTWRWCASTRRKAAKRKVVARFTKRGRVGLVGSNLRRHRAAGIARGDRVGELRAEAEPLGGGLFVRDARGGRVFAYGVRSGRVRFVAVLAPRLASSERALRRNLKRAGLR